MELLSDQEIEQFLVSIPSLVDKLDSDKHTRELNVAENNMRRVEEYVQLLRIVAGLPL